MVNVGCLEGVKPLELKNIGISKVTLFADAEVVSFYKRQGWELEPKGSKCAFWYAN